VTLGLLFAVVVSEDHSLRSLMLPGIVPAALIGSTIVAIAITPVAIWSVRTGARNLWFYGPILWIALAAYVVFAIPRAGHYGQYGLLFVAVIGLVILGFIPAAK
jgi:Na+/melibiose symporter-like transporter